MANTHDYGLEFTLCRARHKGQLFRLLDYLELILRIVW